MTQPIKIAYKVRITGKVQGVCFRDWTRSMADDLKIAGWVRNRQDGSVESVISGYPSDVNIMLAEFEKGPNSANVVSVEKNQCSLPEYFEFRQRPTV